MNELKFDYNYIFEFEIYLVKLDLDIITLALSLILQTHKFVCDIAGFRPVRDRAAPTGQSERTGTICHLIESLYCQMLCWNDPCCHEAPML